MREVVGEEGMASAFPPRNWKASFKRWVIPLEEEEEEEEEELLGVPLTASVVSV
jgi:hypothetical protein